ncbi:MAG TPA: 4-hydroxyphenylpyruvate dioxygenase [Longimicrobiaceae bacterium]|jgi:4-hydroxyphenylpyruvate dioxygenase|nr:4-hydroxyphenylpyruvate dioxygenase [Longimicrobiaceae bacterium]
MAKIEEEVATGSAVQLRGIDHVEMWVGNAFQAAHFYRTIFGFRPIARAGLATGVRDRASFALEQGRIRLVVSSGLYPDSPIAQHVHRHGDGVRDVAFTVDDVEQAFEAAVSRGATPIMEPTAFADDSGRVVKATIGAFGDTVHSFIQRGDYAGRFLPHYQPVDHMGPAAQLGRGLVAVDHVAVSLEEGFLDAQVEFYTNVLGFHQSKHEMVWTERSAMNSKVVEDPTGSIKFPMQEPAPSKGKSQIEEYLDFHKGAGSQHVAYLTEDIFTVVRALQGNGIKFLRVPQTYYQMLEDRIGAVDPADMIPAAELGVQIDREEDGILLQTFTEPLEGRPTFFVEVIERRGAKGFGAGNIKALFESLEAEQALRGNI